MALIQTRNFVDNRLSDEMKTINESESATYLFILKLVRLVTDDPLVRLLLPCHGVDLSLTRGSLGR